MAEKNVEALKGQAWTAAARLLREKYQVEWLTLLRQEYAERGLEWNPRKSQEEKDREQLAELIAKYPDLVTELAAKHPE
jgi:hypothetical protein